MCIQPQAKSSFLLFWRCFITFSIGFGLYEIMILSILLNTINQCLSQQFVPVCLFWNGYWNEYHCVGWWWSIPCLHEWMGCLSFVEGNHWGEIMVLGLGYGTMGWNPVNGYFLGFLLELRMDKFLEKWWIFWEIWSNFCEKSELGGDVPEAAILHYWWWRESIFCWGGCMACDKRECVPTTIWSNRASPIRTHRWGRKRTLWIKACNLPFVFVTRKAKPFLYTAINVLLIVLFLCF